MVNLGGGFLEKVRGIYVVVMLNLSLIECLYEHILAVKRGMVVFYIHPDPAACCVPGCCIYEKPRQFGESSSESEGDDDDEGCGSANCILGHGRKGHVQRPDEGARAPPSAGGTHNH